MARESFMCMPRECRVLLTRSCGGGQGAGRLALSAEVGSSLISLVVRREGGPALSVYAPLPCAPSAHSANLCIMLARTRLSVSALPSLGPSKLPSANGPPRPVGASSVLSPRYVVVLSDVQLVRVCSLAAL
ncbi:hypothetical protein BaRGS_00000615 [Batillaria attramentaria]|uniref:Uncharacterized protein n=1 Tax=Batillaria attramentaria TaxID=370345 RepID=A0ABD0MAA3_9CAEN